MILKELDPFHYEGQERLAARVEADRMAYYLRRHYRRSDTVDVLNGLQVQSGHSLAQVDHLLLHAHGLLVLERDDVVGRVRIDDDGQWQKLVDGDFAPMGSPITRAYVQALLLKAFLDQRVRQKGFFDGLELDVLVVVSDGCEIEWPLSGQLPEVCGREEVFARVSSRIEQSRVAARRPGALTPSERRALAAFLRLSHLPG